MNTLAVSQLIPRGIKARVRAHPAALGVGLTVLAICLLFGSEVAVAGFDVEDWDVLFVSGSLTTLLGLWLARGQRERCEAMVERLANRRALDPRGAAIDAAMQRFEDRTERWARRGGLLIGAVVAAGFVVVHVASDRDRLLAVRIGAPIAGFVGGMLVGRVMGRMASCGGLLRFLAGHGIALTAKPHHVDGAAGLKPLGDFYFRQALLLAIPGVFLLAWWILLLSVSRWDALYGTWRGWYVALFAIVACAQVAAFVVPLVRAHVIMKACKRKALADADTMLATDIARLRAALEGELDNAARLATRERVNDLVARYGEVESMPTWPVDRALRRRVSLGNAALVLGLIAQVATLARHPS